MDRGWGIYPQNDDVVIIAPCDEVDKHELRSKECPCMPEFEFVKNTLMITHHAFDFRDVAEWLNENRK